MKKLVPFITLIFVAIVSYSQKQPAPIKTWGVEASSFEVDNQGNVYTYNSQKIEKYNENGELLATYSNNNLGAINSIDVNNVLRIFVLHKNQNTLVVLDNTLTPEQGSNLDLTLLGLYNTSVFTYSSLNNGIWFYDNEMLQLIKTNSSMEVIYESGNLLQLLNKDSLDVKQLIEDTDKLYLVCKKNILVFDFYGAYYNTIHIPYSKGIKIKNGIVFIFEKGHLKAYDTKTFEEQVSDFIFNTNFLQTMNRGKIYELGKGLFNVYLLK